MHKSFKINLLLIISVLKSRLVIAILRSIKLVTTFVVTHKFKFINWCRYILKMVFLFLKN